MGSTFNQNVIINEELSWGMLKYGLCSYFSLAYANKYPSERFLAIIEYDEEVEKEYLVHFLVVDELNIFVDAEGTYSDWRGSIKDMTDVEFMNLRTKEVDKSFVMQTIEEEIGFDNAWYKSIEKFVDTMY